MTRVLHPWSSVCYPVPAPMAILIRSWSNSDHKQGWWWKCVEDFKLFSEARLSWTTIERLTRIAATHFNSPSILLCCHSFFSCQKLPNHEKNYAGPFDPYKAFAVRRRHLGCSLKIQSTNRMKWLAFPYAHTAGIVRRNCCFFLFLFACS